MIVASTIVPLTDLDALGGEMAVDPQKGHFLRGWFSSRWRDFKKVMSSGTG